MNRLALMLALAAVCGLILSLSVHADDHDDGVRDVGPEDGTLCCTGLVPFLFHGDEVLTTTGRAGIFRSENRGQHWQRSMRGLVAPNGISPFPGFLCQSPSQPNIIYALAGAGPPLSPFNGLFSSDDFGMTWTRRGSVSTGFAINNCAVDADDPRTVYVSGFDDSNFEDTTWKSTDGEQTVQVLTGLPACAAGGNVFPRPGILYVAHGPQCEFASTDSGATFQQLNTPQAPLGGFMVSPDGRAIFVSRKDQNGNPTGAFRSTDRGASFVPVSGLSDVFNLGFDPTNPSRIYNSDSDGLLHVSTDGGLTFALLPASNDPRFLGPIHRIDVDPRGSVYLDTKGGPFRTERKLWPPSSVSKRSCNLLQSSIIGLKIRKEKPSNAGIERRAQTAASDKPCIRSLLTARPLQ